MDPPPSYIDHRIQIFDKLKAEYDEWVKRNYALYKNSPLYNLTWFWVYRASPSRNFYHPSRWVYTVRDELGNNSNGCCKRIIQKSFRTHSNCQSTCKKINNELVFDGFLIGRWRIVGPRASFGKISKT